jgi:L-alanine-DL-glutamate epimerase-like enolase superfamily enzyme
VFESPKIETLNVSSQDEQQTLRETQVQIFLHASSSPSIVGWGEVQPLGAAVTIGSTATSWSDITEFS